MNNKEDALRALTFLQENRLAAFATVSADTKPHVVYVYYMLDNELHLYITTSANSKKLENVRNNNHVALVIGQENEPKTIQVEGVANEVTDSERKQKLMDMYAEIANKNNSDSVPPLLQLLQKTSMAFIEITITTYSFSDFSPIGKLFIEGTAADWK